MDSSPICCICMDKVRAPIRVCRSAHYMCYPCLVTYFNNKYPSDHRQDDIVIECPFCRGVDHELNFFPSQRHGFEPTDLLCVAPPAAVCSSESLSRMYGDSQETPRDWGQTCMFCGMQLHANIDQAYHHILLCTSQTRSCHRAECKEPLYRLSDGFHSHQVNQCTAIKCKFCGMCGRFEELQQHHLYCKTLWEKLNRIDCLMDQLRQIIRNTISFPEESDRRQAALDLLQKEHPSDVFNALQQLLQLRRP